MTLRIPLLVTAVLETGTAAASLLAPRLLVTLLFGQAPAALLVMVLARFIGAAPLSLGLACWWAAQDPESRAAEGVVRAMLLYDVAAALLLAYAGVSGLTGILLWPAVAVHTAMAVWCLLGVLRVKAKRLPLTHSEPLLRRN